MKHYNRHPGVLTALIIINTVIFILLSLLHVYWASGGELWYDAVLPTSSNGLHRLTPDTKSGWLIAAGLLFLAFITIGNQGFFNRYVSIKYFRYGALLIALIFLLRVIGDFKFIGIFKRVKGTKFAVDDTQVFSPLCLFIALLSLLIFIFNRDSCDRIVRKKV